MSLKAIYDTKDAIPAGFADLFTERDGKFELTGIEGIKTQADVDRVQEALRKERTAHDETKGKLRIWGDRKPEDVQKLSDEVEELRIKVGEGGDEKKVEELVNKRVQIALRPVERERDEFRGKVQELTGKIGELETSITRRSLADTLRAASAGEKGIPVRPEAQADIELLAPTAFEEVDGKHVTREGNPFGVDAGLDPKSFLEAVLNSGARPHWFKDSEGAGARNGRGGAGGAGGPNPFAKDSRNMTQVAQLCVKNPSLAIRLAKAAKAIELLPPELRRQAQ